MDAIRVSALREVLTGTGWLESTREFAWALRSSVSRAPDGPGTAGGLLLVGTEGEEPWHMAAHLDNEAAWSGLPQLSPTLVRWRVPPGAPAHLAVDLRRLERAGRGETVLVVAPEAAGAPLLERVHDARRTGATVLALDTGDTELQGLAHEALTVPPTGLREEAAPAFDVVQHLVTAAAGEEPPRGRRRVLDRMARLAERLTAPPPMRW
ncbi:hypothetical protein [Peterkaempfera bronchialis]|uniref:Uncharacterized protein n=1 Tax=Peterkaempfera bronchialis TaxID=2126346 RepID=A0A345SU28_9ACTN|nr:hypothetical protein [Peterkaempfera bronchialis]AXI77233.1 hypothetical protein C7M71_007065 [Peterkaempfera bronchialis]